MNITSVGSAELYEIVTGKNYSSAHISVEEAAEKYPGSQLIKNIINSDKLTVSGNADGAGTPSIAGIYERDFTWGKAGVTGLGAEAIASQIGGIGKRLDDAYKAGKFTDDEYGELNRSLEEYAEKLTARSERAAATQAAGRDGELLLKGLSPKDYRAELESRIEKYLTDKNSEHYCGIDRDMLAEMINRVRYGVLNLLP